MNGELFDWDFENITHIARHGVTPEDAEEAILSGTVDLEAQVVDGEERFREVGMTSSGRFLELVTTVRRQRLRVLTAFPASAKAVQEYFESR